MSIRVTKRDGSIVPIDVYKIKRWLPLDAVVQTVIL